MKCRDILRCLAVAGTVAILACAAPVAADDVVTLSYTRDAGGATVDQSYILIHNNDAEGDISLPDTVATVILFTGGRGRLRVADEQISIDTANFLVRNRWLFAANGQFNVAVMDAASDFLDNGIFPNGLRGNRTSPEHLEDIQRMIADLRTRFPGLPVWVVGTSRGSTSAAHAAAEMVPPMGPDGMVLTSSVTIGTGSVLSDVILGSVTVPSLIVAHEDDDCVVTPPSDAQVIADSLTGAPKVKVRTFDGGVMAISDACGALSPHGFLGIEQKVVRRISKWIRKH